MATTSGRADEWRASRDAEREAREAAVPKGESARRPDWNVHAMDFRMPQQKSRVGAAWNRPDGTIQIKLNPFVVLQGHTELLVTLFPADDSHRRTKNVQPADPRGSDDPSDRF